MVLPDIDIDIPLDDLAEAVEQGLISSAEALERGLQNLGDEIGEDLREVGAATLSVIENSGIALIKAGAKTKEYFVDEIGERRVQFVKNITVILIGLMTIVFIYNSILMKDR